MDTTMRPTRIVVRGKHLAQELDSPREGGSPETTMDPVDAQRYENP
jgi:hypothetical protein